MNNSVGVYLPAEVIFIYLQNTTSTIISTLHFIIINYFIIHTPYTFLNKLNMHSFYGIHTEL